MKQPSERLTRVIELQRRAFFLNALLSAILSFVSVNAIDIQNFFLQVIAWVFLTRLFLMLLNTVVLMIIQLKVYQGDTASLVEDATAYAKAINTPVPYQPGAEMLMMKIINVPDKPIGKFMDADIYEWLDLEDSNGVTRHFEFVGTVNMENGEVAPQGMLTLPPGLIYEPKSQVNIPSINT
jgi:hypothetical protein